MTQLDLGFNYTVTEQTILNELRHGRANARTSAYFMQCAGLKDPEVRQTMRHLIIDHGVLIASSGAGFYIPETPAEITEATRSLRHRGISILVRAAKLQKLSITEVFNQSVIEYEGQNVR